MKELLSALFVNSYFVDENYHKKHPQLIHRHETELELFYVIKGEGNYILNGKKYFVKEGNLIICNKGALHGEALTHDNTMNSYTCAVRGIDILQLSKNAHELIFFENEEKQTIEGLFKAVHNINTSKQDKNLCNLLSDCILNIVYNKINIQNSIVSKSTSKRNSEFISQIIKYLDENYKEQVTLKELSEKFSLSMFHLSRIFKEETGFSPINYVTNRKIGEAQNLLMNSNLKIIDISSSVGFNDIAHFSMMFKKIVGITPTEYRKHFKTFD